MERQRGRGPRRRHNGGPGRSTEVEVNPRGQESRGSSRATEGRQALVPRGWEPTPVDVMRRWARDMNRTLENWGIAPGSALENWLTAPSTMMGALAGWPPIEMVERDGRMVLRAELPGVKREDIRVRVMEGALLIEGERRNERQEDDRGFYRSEWSYGRFSRRIPLPGGVEPEDVQARFRDGVLEVSFEMTEELGREVPIEASESRGERRSGRGS